ncbi:L-threonine aldolase [Paenibacillus nuruki]|uniref:L-threonine aldolase n=1 Tax=Paenibacillus nuruki TaxID=1886670 RepID=A0A1E3L8N4_9BACL|nr:low-specificity L-threonine aldolase [Paenibacillus nuruki]ODP30118.1 L-threonine aldolase [Paenibacillus nuruki]
MDKSIKIELRSDTFTLPTSAMLTAMTQAKLGDDVYGEDPTVRELEAKAAHMLGKEAAIFMPSGTMANLASIMAHCPRGTKVLVGDESDIYIYEAAGASICGGVMYEPIKTKSDGRLDLYDLQQSIPRDTTDPQFALPGLICLENPHNRMGGRVLPLSYLVDIQRFSKQHNIPVHMDGARIWNAAITMGIPASTIASYVDSIQFCLSKGLSAPIGSMVAGSQAFIQNVYRIRKMLGGGMRQTGVIAAAGIVALDQMINRLEDDHINARLLAKGLAKIPGIICETQVETNIVFFRVTDSRFTWEKVVHFLQQHGVYVDELGHGRIRAVTHAGIKTEHIEQALKVIRHMLA